jgi:hypothetical protein
MATRSDDGDDYAHEMTDADHFELLAFLQSLKGMVVLSGYPHPLYDEALAGWRREERRPGRWCQEAHRSSLDQPAGCWTPFRRTESFQADSLTLSELYAFTRFEMCGAVLFGFMVGVLTVFLATLH